MSATSQNLNQANDYDAAGNVTGDGVNQYLYDGEGRICAVASPGLWGSPILTGYVYDADGNRVAKGMITAWSCDPSANGLTTVGNETDYVLGPSGEQVTEVAPQSDGTMLAQRTYVYAAGALFATYDPVSNPAYNPSDPSAAPQMLYVPSFRVTDWLGTLRATTDMNGAGQSTCTGLPYADGVSCAGNTSDPHYFTGKERDTESGNDYFGARYYASTMGRWMSPDLPLADQDPADPQSWNLYRRVAPVSMALPNEDEGGGWPRSRWRFQMKMRVPPVPRFWGPGL